MPDDIRLSGRDIIPMRDEVETLLREIAETNRLDSLETAYMIGKVWDIVDQTITDASYAREGHISDIV